MADTATEKVKKVKKKRIVALRPSQVVNKKRVVYEFDGEWLRCYGKIERIAKIFITGRSFSGKSSYIYQLCEYVCKFGNVDYNSFEEGDSQTTAAKLERHGLLNHDSAFKLLPKLHIDDFDQRLSRKRSASFGVLDSIQHGGINKKRYDEFVYRYTRNPKTGKCLIFVSHNIKNELTLHVRHDCDVKIDVIGFVARVESRYGDGIKHHLIWEKGAKEYWGKKYKQVLAGTYWPGQKK